ncbi:MAG: hypothetical protein Q8P64_10075 [Deltaproteobacteria bacterium]|nr:hypothetical protein [Deltaproteobacteria bacterium]
MEPLIVSLDGITTEIRRLKIDLKQLILDIENPCIQYFLDRRGEYFRYSLCLPAGRQALCALLYENGAG